MRFNVVEVIPDARDPSVPYLHRRMLVQSAGLSLYLHHILEPDRDRDLHDHPRSFLAFILKGGYVETLRESWGAAPRLRRHRRFGFNLMLRGRAHRIETLQPGTTTLLILGPKRGDWGFWTSEGWVQHRQYIIEKYGIAAICHPVRTEEKALVAA